MSTISQVDSSSRIVPSTDPVVDAEYAAFREETEPKIVAIRERNPLAALSANQTQNGRGCVHAVEVLIEKGSWQAVYDLSRRMLNVVHATSPQRGYLLTAQARALMHLDPQSHNDENSSGR